MLKIFLSLSVISQISNFSYFQNFISSPIFTLLPEIWLFTGFNKRKILFWIKKIQTFILYLAFVIILMKGRHPFFVKNFVFKIFPCFLKSFPDICCRKYFFKHLERIPELILRKDFWSEMERTHKVLDFNREWIITVIESTRNMWHALTLLAEQKRHFACCRWYLPCYM